MLGVEANVRPTYFADEPAMYALPLEECDDSSIVGIHMRTEWKIQGSPDAERHLIIVGLLPFEESHEW